jgi:hypothetical protein
MDNLVIEIFMFWVIVECPYVATDRKTIKYLWKTTIGMVHIIYTHLL